METHWIGRLAGVSEPIRAAQRFLLAGIDWQTPADVRIELRARRVAGGWTPWVPASVLGHDSDRGETIAHALVGEPVWTGPAEAVQLRSSAPVQGLNLHVVLASAVAESDAPPAGADHFLHHPASAAQGLPLAAPHLPAGPGQPPILARHAWAGGLLPRAEPGYGDVRMAFVHHSVNANGYSAAEVPAMLRSIYYFHTYTRGWNDIGYNFAVDAYGRIWEARAGGIDRPVIGAQAGGYNLESFGAVLLGDYSATLPTPEAQNALAHLVAWKLALHGVPVSGRVTVEVDPPDAYFTRFRPGQRVSLPRVAGHRDGCTTDCPGNDMYVYGMPPLRRRVAQIVGRQLALTIDVGPGPHVPYALAPYAIAPGTKAKRATYLDLATVTLTAGRELPLHGRLQSLEGAPVAAAAIVLEDITATRRQDLEPRVSRAVTLHDGVWTATLRPHVNMLLRAVHIHAPAVASSLIALGVAPEVTLHASSEADGIRAFGTVTPAKRHIVLEMRSASGHRVLEHRTVDLHGGSFEARIRMPRGRYWVRALTIPDAANVAGESPVVAVHV